MLTFCKRGELTFTAVGYDNWKKALEKFKRHESCETHQEAMLKWKLHKLPSVSEQLSSVVKREQAVRRQGLLKLLHRL